MQLEQRYMCKQLFFPCLVSWRACVLYHHTGDLSSAAAQNQQGQTQIHRWPPGESGALRCRSRQRQQGDTLHREQWWLKPLPKHTQMWPFQQLLLIIFQVSYDKYFVRKLNMFIVHEGVSWTLIPSLQGSTRCGTRDSSSTSMFQSWSWCGLWWRTMTQHPRMISSDSIVYHSPAYRMVRQSSLNCRSYWNIKKKIKPSQGQMFCRRFF